MLIIIGLIDSYVLNEHTTEPSLNDSYFGVSRFNLLANVSTCFYTLIFFQIR